MESLIVFSMRREGEGERLNGTTTLADFDSPFEDIPPFLGEGAWEIMLTGEPVAFGIERIDIGDSFPGLPSAAC